MPRTNHPDADAPKPPLREWYFDDCPSDLWQQCWDYEHARHVPEIVSLFEQNVAAGKARADGVVPVGKLRKNKDGSFRSLDAILLPPGFPVKPFLETDWKKLHPQAKEEKPRPQSDKEKKLRQLYKAGLRAVVEASLGGINAPSLVPHPLTLVDEAGVATPLESEPFDTTRHRLIIVDLHKHRATLEKAFSRFLDAHWQPENADRNKRGKTPEAMLKADLRALGAWRLLRVMSIQAAMYYTQAHSPDQHPLFKEADKWSKAKKAAGGNLAALKARFA